MIELKQALIKLHWLLASQFGLDPRIFMQTLRDLPIYLRDWAAFRKGYWYALLRQEITRLGALERQRGNWAWPFAYAYALLGLAYFKLRSNKRAEDLACFGWHCVTVKQ